MNHTTLHQQRRSGEGMQSSSSSSSHILRLVVLVAALPHLVQGQFSFCTPLANETWTGLVQAIRDSYRLAVLCPFEISGDGCPSVEEYPEGLVFGRDGNDIMIVECDPDLNDRYNDDNYSSKCIIDCPGRHFTVAPSPTGLILTNMILSGATNSSIYVEANGSLEVVNTAFYNNSAGGNNGGAVAVEYGSNFEAEFSTFRDNKAALGGAIYAQESTVKVKQSTFSGNEATAAGGAIATDAASVLDIDFTSFSKNEGAEGGAIYTAEYGELSVSRSVFEENFAILGGAIFTSGVATIDESTFKDNTGVEGGGAINCDIGSTTTLIRNTLMNNGSSGYGPAVYDRYSTGVAKEGNTACGNQVMIDGRVPMNRNVQCEGVYAPAGRRIMRRCQLFENQCLAPTMQPLTASPTSPAPTSSPSASPSAVPTITPTTSEPSSQPTSPPSSAPSIKPSRSVSDAPSTAPSSLPSHVIIVSEAPSSSRPTFGQSLIPSDTPSLVPSDAPSLAPTNAPSLAPTNTPSSIPSDSPSPIPSNEPSPATTEETIMEFP